MSPELDFSMSAHEEEGSSPGTSTRTTLAPKGLKVQKEPPQNIEEPTTKNLTKGLEVHKEPLRLKIP